MAPEIACLTRGMTRHQLCEHGVRRGARDAPRGPHGIPDAELPSLHACQETRDVTAWRHTGEEAVRERLSLAPWAGDFARLLYVPRADVEEFAEGEIDGHARFVLRDIDVQRASRRAGR